MSCHTTDLCTWVLYLFVLMSGYVGSSSNLSVAYRVETFPGFGFLLRKSFYEEVMVNKLPQCCHVRWVW